MGTFQLEQMVRPMVLTVTGWDKKILNMSLASTETSETVPEKEVLGKFMKVFMCKNNRKKQYEQFYFKD